MIMLFTKNRKLKLQRHRRCKHRGSQRQFNIFIKTTGKISIFSPTSSFSTISGFTCEDKNRNVTSKKTKIKVTTLIMKSGKEVVKKKMVRLGTWIKRYEFHMYVIQFLKDLCYSSFLLNAYSYDCLYMIMHSLQQLNVLCSGE